jgi:hypothetical protein
MGCFCNLEVEMRSKTRAWLAVGAVASIAWLGGCVDSTPAGEAVLEGRETGDYTGISGTPDTVGFQRLEGRLDTLGQQRLDTLQVPPPQPQQPR